MAAGKPKVSNARFTGNATPHPIPAEHVWLVEFEDGAHTFWHRHENEQVLFVMRGRGWLQYWEGEGRELKPGDIVHITPGAKHWHGAQAGESMAHLAISTGTTEWLEEVSD